MSTDSSQKTQKIKKFVKKTGFLLLVLFSVAALTITFVLSISSLGFSAKLAGFIALTAVYLGLVAVVYKFQSQPVESILAEITSENIEKSPEQTFSGEIEEKLLALEEANTIFSSSLKPADMFRLVSNRIKEIIPFTLSLLYLAEAGREKLKISYAFGSGAVSLTGIETELDAGLVAKAFQTREIQTSREFSFEKSVFPVEILAELKSAIACPLTYEEQTYAVLALYNSEDTDYGAESKKVLEAIGTRISPLFINSMTFESNLNSALNDSITGLPNERALFMMLENQVAESQRFREQRPLTVLSIDVKDFAELNSKYGHLTGDRILRFVAGHIKEQLRQMDFLSRLAGDEFLAVLPTSSDKTTEMIVERIKKTFAANPFTVAGEEKVLIDLNFGAASFIRDGETAQDLIKMAAVKRHEAKSPIKSTVLWFPKEYSN